MDYSIAPRDCIGTCLLIGRTASTAENTKIGMPLVDLLLHHGAYIRDMEVLDFYKKNLPIEFYEKELNNLKNIWNVDNKYMGPTMKTLEE